MHILKAHHTQTFTQTAIVADSALGWHGFVKVCTSGSSPVVQCLYMWDSASTMTPLIKDFTIAVQCCFTVCLCYVLCLSPNFSWTWQQPHCMPWTMNTSGQHTENMTNGCAQMSQPFIIDEVGATRTASKVAMGACKREANDFLALLPCLLLLRFMNSTFSSLSVEGHIRPMIWFTVWKSIFILQYYYTNLYSVLLISLNSVQSTVQNVLKFWACLLDSYLLCYQGLTIFYI